MTRVDFYLLPDSETGGRDGWVCRLVEKAWRQGHRVYVRTGSEAETQRLDNLLWTFRQGSFVPHQTHPGADPETPILVGHGPAPDGFRDVLVNLGAEVPEDYPEFQRVAEVIDADEARRAAGRVRFRHYRDAGYPLETHKLDAGG